MKLTKDQRVAVLKWFEDIHSHSVYDYARSVVDFKNDTGLDAPWVPVTRAVIKRQMEARPAGGELLPGSPKDLLCSGYAMAEACAEAWGTRPSRGCMGLGFRFRDALDRIRP